jgi:hypothetical protein
VGLALALPACTGEKVSAVQPQLKLSATSLDFGTVPVLQHKDLALHLVNLGRAPLHVSHVIIADLVDGGAGNGGAGTFDFGGADGGLAPTEVAAGTTADIVVTFTPPAEQPYAATLVLETDDPAARLPQVALSGKGSTHATIAVSSVAHPGQESIDFGRVGEGRVALAGLEVKSTGTADLILEGLTLSGDPAVSFNSSARTPATVPMGTSLVLQLKYAPPEGAPDAVHATLTLRTTDPARQVITVPITGHINRAPVPVIAQTGPLAPGQTLTLDGSGSADPDHDDPIAFVDALGQPGWALVRAPINSAAALSPGDTAHAQITFDLPGQYVVRLTVTDKTGLESLHPAEATLLAKPAQALAVELVWDNPDTDLDLHFFPASSTLGSAKDCWANNRHPDLGVLGDDTDDPSLSRDALDHFGPEEMVYAAPVGDTYQIAVVFYSSHGSVTPQTKATVRVYEFGEVTSELSYTFTAQGQVWKAAQLTWPSGAVVAGGATP